MAPDHLCNLGELTLQECRLIASAIVVVVFVHHSAPKTSLDVLSSRQHSAGQTSEKGMSWEKVFWQTGWDDPTLMLCQRFKLTRVWSGP